EFEDGIEAGVGRVKLSGISQMRTNVQPLFPGEPGRFVDMIGHRLDQGDGVTPRRQPPGVVARPAAHVEDRSRRWRQVTTEKLLSAQEFQTALQVVKSGALASAGVVREDVVLHAHRAALRAL